MGRTETDATFVSKAHQPAKTRARRSKVAGGLKTANGHATSRGSFAEGYLSYLLSRASHIVASGFHKKLKNYKLTVPEYRVLACLTGAEGLGVGDLAAMAIMEQSRMTKILDRMEKQGFVERRSDAKDRRRVLIHLTDEGRTRAAPVLRAAKEHEANMLAPLTPDERSMILHSLDLLIRERAARSKD